MEHVWNYLWPIEKKKSSFREGVLYLAEKSLEAAMSLSYAVLGLINYKPMTGNDLKKFFDDSINFFWSVQTSQIYRELKTWEQKGSIVSFGE